MTGLDWLDDQSPIVAQGFEGLLELANRPVATDDQVRSEFGRQVAEYLAAVRDRARLPPHAYPAGMFFTDILPTRDIADLAGSRGDMGAPLAPVAPLPQTTNLVKRPRRAIDPAVVGRPHVNELSLQPPPDPGRRIQLWWDERAPGQPSLGPDEIIRFIRRGAWRGSVDQITGQRFRATLQDLMTPGVREEAEFFMSQVSAADRGRLVIGAPFYWTIGYTENSLGERTAASRIRFKRVSPVAPPELRAEARAAGRRIADAFGLPPRSEQ